MSLESFVAFVVSMSVSSLVVFWVLTRWMSHKPIIPKRKPSEQPLTKEEPDPGEKYLASIRWKGEIYCQCCGATLQRIPWQEKWWAIPGFDPMTGTKLSDVERYGNAALMVCSKYEEDRTSPTAPMSIFSYSRPQSFQRYFDERGQPDHAMYYTNKAPLT